VGLCGLPVTWQAQLGDCYETFKASFLQSRPERRAQFFPCPNGCPQAHEVFYYGPRDIVACCRCESSTCEDLALAPADVIPLELSWPRLGRALCQAFGLTTKLASLGIPNTRQIGAWSGAAVPALLTIQTNRLQFRSVVTELVARLHQPFILLVPTARHLNAVTQELLANIGAAFFPLETHLRLGREGKLICTKLPGEIFARFSSSATKPVAEEEARTALSLVRALDSELRARKAPVYTVFRLYCVEGLTAEEIARKCRCARALIYFRLEWLRQKLGRDPAELRQYSAHFEEMEKNLSDPRARLIYRKGAAYGDDPDENE
jgi:hypothetical protein